MSPLNSIQRVDKEEAKECILSISGRGERYAALFKGSVKAECRKMCEISILDAG